MLTGIALILAPLGIAILGAFVEYLIGPKPSRDYQPTTIPLTRLEPGMRYRPIR